jgi:hypothetical protein
MSCCRRRWDDDDVANRRNDWEGKRAVKFWRDTRNVPSPTTNAASVASSYGVMSTLVVVVVAVVGLLLPARSSRCTTGDPRWECCGRATTLNMPSLLLLPLLRHNDHLVDEKERKSQVQTTWTDITVGSKYNKITLLFFGIRTSHSPVVFAFVLQ